MLAAVLCVILWLKLGLAKDLFVNSTRCFVQLTLVGFILNWAFGPGSPAKLALIVFVMITIAAHTAGSHQKWRQKGLKTRIFASLLVSLLLTMIPLLTLILEIEPWYKPQYSIPLAGMVLSNSMNGLVLYLERLRAELKSRVPEFEGYLSVGASIWHAIFPMVRDSAHAALLPRLNELAIIGIVALPGMMSGQIIAGVNPIEAVKYQIIVMYLLTSGVALAIIAMVAQSTWLVAAAKLPAENGGAAHTKKRTAA